MQHRKTKEIDRHWSWFIVVFAFLVSLVIVFKHHDDDIEIMEMGLKERFEPMSIHTCMINDSAYHVSFGDEACILIENGADETRIMYHSQYETLYYVQDSIIVTVINKDRSVSYAVDADTLVRHKDNVVLKN